MLIHRILATLVGLLVSGSALADSVTGQRTTNVQIPDFNPNLPNAGWVSSIITISGAPAGSTVTSIDVTFTVDHDYASDLVIDLNADAQGDDGNHTLWNRSGSGPTPLPITRNITGIHTYDGLSVNRLWYLYAKDYAQVDTGFIDEWRITIYYNGPRPGSFTLSNETPICDTNPPVAPAVRLNWSNSSNFTTYNLYRDNNLYSQGITGQTFYNSANVAAGQTYTYFVRAINGNGTRDSNTITVSIPSNICTPTPGAPDLTAAIANSSDGLIQWTDNANNEEGFRVQRKLGTGGSWTTLSTIFNPISGIGGSFVHQDSGLAFGNVYYYRVYAFIGTQTATSDELAVTALDRPDLESPSNGETVPTNQVTLEWNAVIGANQYAVEWLDSCDTSPNVLSSQDVNGTSLSLDLSNGVRYWRVRAKHVGGALGLSAPSFCRSFSVNAIPGPSNDNCLNALAISVGTRSFSTVGATTDGPIPTTCSGSSGSMFGADVWFTYTATADGTLSVSTCGTNFDTMLLVYSGGSCPVTNGRQMWCNDDSQCDSGFQQSLVPVNVTAGSSYKIRVGGYNSARGEGTLQLSFTPPPPPIAGPLPAPLPGQNKLIVITHGWNTSQESLDNFWTPLANAIRARAPSDFQVVLYDWAEASRTPLLLFPVAPDIALVRGMRRGNAIGQQIGQQISENHQWQYVQLIGHSAGCGLISQAAYRINQADEFNSTVIHTTFLDAFAGAGLVFGIENYKEFYGGNSDWSDYYRSLESLDPLICAIYNGENRTGPLTQLDLPKTHRFDVTFVDPNLDFVCLSSHRWPYCFYGYSVGGWTIGDCDTPRGGADEFGFWLSYAARGGNLSEWLQEVTTNYRLGSQTPVGPDGIVSPVNVEFHAPRNPTIPLADTPSLTSSTEAVQIAEGVLTMTTQAPNAPAPSPVWIDFQISSDSPTNFVAFEMEFSSISDGGTALLTLYADGMECGVLDEPFALSGFNAYAMPTQGVLNPGAHVLSFRLDPFNSVSSRVAIRNVATGLSTFVPICFADFNDDETVDFFDYLDFVAAFSDNAPAADFNQDSSIDFFDYLDFVQAFSSGC